MPIRQLFWIIMESSGTIMYWFREPAMPDEISCLCRESEGCRELIPVFCFDSREEKLTETAEYRQNVLRVTRLREELKSKGSNLLVVYNHYEIIIPSLARVLKASKVLTHPIFTASQNTPLYDFREEKFREVSHLLNMHSIPLRTTHLNGGAGRIPLPLFPSINPGSIRL